MPYFKPQSGWLGHSTAGSPYNGHLLWAVLGFPHCQNNFSAGLVSFHYSPEIILEHQSSKREPLAEYKPCAISLVTWSIGFLMRSEAALPPEPCGGESLPIRKRVLLLGIQRTKKQQSCMTMKILLLIMTFFPCLLLCLFLRTINI